MPRKPLISPGSILPPEVSDGPREDLLSRVIAKDRARRLADNSVPSAEARNNITANITDNMTGQPSDHLSDNTTSSTVILPEGNMTSQSDDSTASLPSDNMASQPASQPASNTTPALGVTVSMAERIRQTARAHSGPPSLKVVTIKLPPDLDERVEEHCYNARRKKQDVIRDALLLYFEALGEE